MSETTDQTTAAVDTLEDDVVIEGDPIFISSVRIVSLDEVWINGNNVGGLADALINWTNLSENPTIDQVKGVGLFVESLRDYMLASSNDTSTAIQERDLALQNVSSLQNQLSAVRVERDELIAQVEALTRRPDINWSAFRIYIMSQEAYAGYAATARANNITGQILSLLQHAIAMENPSSDLISQLWNRLNSMITSTNLPLSNWNDKCIEFSVPLRWNPQTGSLIKVDELQTN